MEGLVVRYGARTAVAGMDLTALPGSITALVGPNGAGKTSTIEACVGLRRAEGGVIEVLGAQVVGPHAGRLPRDRIGVVLQDGGLYPTARPLALARHVARLHGTHEDPAPLLASLGLDPGTRTTIRRLSGGEQQRVKCALALIGSPELVFLDEPTAGLDSAGRRAVHDLLRERRDAGVAIVLTTHLMDDVERLADDVVIMGSGRRIAAGSVDDLIGTEDTIWFSGPRHADLTGLRAALPETAVLVEEHPGRFRVSGAGDPMTLGAIASWCAQHGIPTTGLGLGRRSLDDVVHDLTREQP